MPRYAYSVCKVFVECQLIGGSFIENVETLQIGWFTKDQLPPLAEEKNTQAQIDLCFAAHETLNWQVFFD